MGNNETTLESPPVSDLRRDMRELKTTLARAAGMLESHAISLEAGGLMGCAKSSRDMAEECRQAAGYASFKHHETDQRDQT